mgnify:CR=1 FL=1
MSHGYRKITVAFITSHFLFVLIDSSDKKVFTVKLNELDRYLSNKDEVLLSIDKSTEYKNVIEIIDKLKSIGITKINLNSMSEGEKL